MSEANASDATINIKAVENVVKFNVYCTDPAYFSQFNEVYARYFPNESPARISLCVPCFPGPFDIEVDCVAVVL